MVNEEELVYRSRATIGPFEFEVFFTYFAKADEADTTTNEANREFHRLVMNCCQTSNRITLELSLCAGMEQEIAPLFDGIGIYGINPSNGDLALKEDSAFNTGTSLKQNGESEEAGRATVRHTPQTNRNGKRHLQLAMRMDIFVPTQVGSLRMAFKLSDRWTQFAWISA